MEVTAAHKGSGKGICVIQMAKLGDLIQTTPLLSQLKRHYPGEELTLVSGQKELSAVAAQLPLVDAVVDISELEDSVDNGASINNREQLPDSLRRKFIALYTLNSHRRALALAQKIEAEQKYGPELCGTEIKFTAVQNFLLAIMSEERSLGRFNLVDVWSSLCPQTKEPLPLKWFSGSDSVLPATEAQFTIALQMGSRHHLRRWPVESFTALTAELTRLLPSFRLLLFGSKDEKSLGKKFESLWAKENVPLEIHNLIGQTNLAELAGLCAVSDLLVTGDTGVLHLAAASATKVLALFFGPAYGPETGPYGSGHLIYQAQAPCGPCREDGACRERLCRSLPDPQIAAHFAVTQLKGELASLNNLPNLPQGHRLWQTEIDEFGQTLKPLGSPPLIDGEALALILTECGRNLLRPSYQINASRLKKQLEAYQNREVAIDDTLLKRVVQRAFGQSLEIGREFEGAARSLACEVGFNIAYN